MTKHETILFEDEKMGYKTLFEHNFVISCNSDGSYVVSKKCLAVLDANNVRYKSQG
ncbi:MAG: hypothetical protein ACREBJ_02615 [Nitrosotalea sp.]